MLRPRTVFRFIFYATLSWLALAALYVGLPSFSRHDNGTDYATNVLKSGRTLTRVYRADEFFPAGHFASYTSNNEERSNIALTFKIDHASDLLVICGNGRVPLSRPAALTPIQQQEEENEGYVRLETPVHVSALAGDTDGVNLPWFDTADAVLMFYLISRDEVLVNLHAVFKQGGTKLELWPGRGNWTGLPVAQNEYPLLSLTLDSSHDGDRRVLMASAPPPPLSLSPTPTYPIRFTLLLVLAPLTIGGLAIYMGIVFVLYAVLNLFFRLFWIWAFSLLVCWLYKGRPPVDDFVNDVINDIAGIFAKVRNWMSRSLSSRAGDEEKQAPPGQQASHTEFESKS